MPFSHLLTTWPLTESFIALLSHLRILRRSLLAASFRLQFLPVRFTIRVIRPNGLGFESGNTPPLRRPEHLWSADKKRSLLLPHLATSS